MVKVFPWEGKVGRPMRVFPESTSIHEHEHEHAHQQEQTTASSGWQEEDDEEENTEKSEIETLASWKSPSPSPSPSIIGEERPTPSFENYTHSNAWDQVPEIQQYIESIQKARETRRSQDTSGTGTPVSLSTPSTPSVAVRGSHLRLGNLGLSSRSSSSSLSSSNNNRDKTNTTTTEPPPDLLQDDWTSLTMDGFVRLLQFMYLYCTFTTTAKAGASSASTR